jgi:hypothetical protein
MRWVLMLIFLLYSTFCYSLDVLNYEVIGISRNTGEQVEGVVWSNQVDPSLLLGSLKKENCKDVISVIGSWSGVGMMELKNKIDSNDIYDVEVIE